MATKLSKTQYFIFASLFVGICGSIVEKEFWSATVLAESSLILFSLTYLVSKYYASKIIQKYQDYDYSPNKTERLLDDVKVETTFHIIIPVSLSLLYASWVLLLLKRCPISWYKTIGGIINPLIDFQKQYIKYPVSLLLTVLAILTLTRYLSVKKYKSFQQTSKYITSPFKIAFILSFFLVQDKGIRNNLLKYQFNSSPVISQFVTFNSNYSAQDEQIEKALQEYTKYVVARLDDNVNSEFTEDTAQTKVSPNAFKLKSFVKEFPQVKEQVLHNVKDASTYQIGNNDQAFNSYHETVWNYSEEKPKSSNLYEQAVTKEPTFYDNFISILGDERKTIKKQNLSDEAEIIQTLMGDFWDEIFPFDKFTDAIPLHKIIKDKAVDVLNSKLINGFYALLKKATVTKEDISSLNAYIDNVVADDYRSSVKSVQNKFNVLREYYAELNKTATNAYFEELGKNADHSIVTYEDGITNKKNYLELTRKKLLTDPAEKEKILDEWEKLYPDIPREELESSYAPSINKNTDDQILEIDNVLSQKEKLKDYGFIRDKFSAGGIFFGLPISPSENAANACSDTYFPEINNCPNSILKEEIIALELKNEHIVISTRHGKFRTSAPIAKNLLLAAYNYVYSSDTYPVLVDGFFDDNKNETFAYNKNITYDRSITGMLFSADNFIFDVLDNKIKDPETQYKLRDAISSYSTSKKDVALSRIYDDGYYITTTPTSNFKVNTKLKFSVVSKQDKSEYTSDKKYVEIGGISSPINEHYIWLLNKYPYLRDLTTFASYQALFRTLKQQRVDISDLILKRR